MKEREIIQVTEFEIAPLCYEYYWENVEEEVYDEYFNENRELIKHHFSDDFEVVDENVTDYDLEKSYEDKDTIIKRKSDGKYFKASWTDGYYDNIYPTEIIEVFPIEKMIIAYE
jgi:hypothetical protein